MEEEEGVGSSGFSSDTLVFGWEEIRERGAAEVRGVLEGGPGGGWEEGRGVLEGEPGGGWEEVRGVLEGGPGGGWEEVREVLVGGPGGGWEEGRGVLEGGPGGGWEEGRGVLEGGPGGGVGEGREAVVGTGTVLCWLEAAASSIAGWCGACWDIPCPRSREAAAAMLVDTGGGA